MGWIQKSSSHAQQLKTAAAAYLTVNSCSSLVSHIFCMSLTPCSVPLSLCVSSFPSSPPIPVTLANVLGKQSEKGGLINRAVQLFLHSREGANVQNEKEKMLMCENFLG